MRPRDSQRRRLYLWEGEALGLWQGAPDLTPGKARALLRRVWSFAGFPKGTEPRFLVNGRRSGAVARAWGFQIEAGKNALRRLVVLHEAAHCIISRRLPFCRPESHGPEFVSVYIRLVERFGRTGLSGLRASAKSYGLRVASQEEAECRFLGKPGRPAKQLRLRGLTDQTLRSRKPLTEDEAERQYEEDALRETA